MVTICQTCGDRGFSMSFIYCEKCQDYAVHSYCHDVIPTNFDENFTWFCEGCKPIVVKNVSCSVSSPANKKIQISESSFQDEAKYGDDSDEDWKLRDEQEMDVDDEQQNEYEETCLNPQPLIDPICYKNHINTLQSNNEEGAAGQLSTNSTTQKKRVRGPVKLSHLQINGVEPEVVKYNSKGQAIGKASVRMSSYLGFLGRTMVPIIYKSWTKVPEKLKDEIWSYVKRAYTVDPERKSSVLFSTSVSWRGFKNKLTTKYILPYKDQPELLTRPPEDYNFIKQEHWDVFVRSRLSEEFLKMRQLQKERQAKNIYKHRLGRKGYARLREELKRSSGMGNEIDRSILWKEGHKNKKGEFVDKEVKQCADKIDGLTKLVEDGIVATAGSNDILTMALGTAEHSGKVRGIGHSVTLKSYFNPRKCRHSRLEEQQKLMALQIESLQQEVKTLKELLLKAATPTPQSEGTSCGTSNVQVSPSSGENVSKLTTEWKIKEEVLK